jgi:hypothetical protein
VQGNKNRSFAGRRNNSAYWRSRALLKNREEGLESGKKALGYLELNEKKNVGLYNWGRAQRHYYIGHPYGQRFRGHQPWGDQQVF